MGGGGDRLNSSDIVFKNFIKSLKVTYLRFFIRGLEKSYSTLKFQMDTVTNFCRDLSPEGFVQNVISQKMTKIYDS